VHQDNNNHAAADVHQDNNSHAGDVHQDNNNHAAGDVHQDNNNHAAADVHQDNNSHGEVLMDNIEVDDEEIGGRRCWPLSRSSVTTPSKSGHRTRKRLRQNGCAVM